MKDRIIDCLEYDGKQVFKLQAIERIDQDQDNNWNVLTIEGYTYIISCSKNITLSKQDAIFY